jgi:hypothetical protein
MPHQTGKAGLGSKGILQLVHVSKQPCLKFENTKGIIRNRKSKGG